MLLFSLTLNYIRALQQGKLEGYTCVLGSSNAKKKHGEIFENINFSLKYDTNKVYNPSKNISFVSYIIPTVKLGSRILWSSAQR